MKEENFKSIESLNFKTVSWDIQDIIKKEPLVIVKRICTEIIVFFIALVLFLIFILTDFAFTEIGMWVLIGIMCIGFATAGIIIMDFFKVIKTSKMKNDLKKESVQIAPAKVVKLDYEYMSKGAYYNVYACIKSMDDFMINESVKCIADAPRAKVPKLNFKDDIIYILRYEGFGKYVYYGLEENSKECFEKSMEKI